MFTRRSATIERLDWAESTADSILSRAFQCTDRSTDRVHGMFHGMFVYFVWHDMFV